jgi:hypothetical protein
MPHVPDSLNPSQAPSLTGAQKSAATVQRRRDERRAERLREIRDQTAAGTLTIRQMTRQEHRGQIELARQARARHDLRPRGYTSPER